MCDGLGYWHLSGCPYEAATPEAWELLAMTRQMDKGSLPVAGGWMDQPARWLHAAQFVRAERSRIKASQASGLHPLAAMLLLWGGGDG